MICIQGQVKSSDVVDSKQLLPLAQKEN